MKKITISLTHFESGTWLVSSDTLGPTPVKNQSILPMCGAEWSTYFPARQIRKVSNVCLEALLGNEEAGNYLEETCPELFSYYINPRASEFKQLRRASVA